MTMAYDAAFFERYARYQEEKTVREAHDWIFEIAYLDPAFENVIDLGCGVCEFLLRTNPVTYFGVDLEVHRPETGRQYAIDRPLYREGWSSPGDTVLRREFYANTDYRQPDFPMLIRECSPIRPRAFYSGFSSEISEHWPDNYDLYQRLFREIPSLEVGLVAGFFYTSQLKRPVVGETGGVLSWQTLEPPYAVYNDVFSERRIEMPVPSEMFSSQENDIYEVWKFFKRR
jgi:hypothetical protein